MHTTAVPGDARLLFPSVWIEDPGQSAGQHHRCDPQVQPRAREDSNLWPSVPQ